MKALFIPLKTEYYEAFCIWGEKQSELRLYGARWNEKTCHIGRPVVLSKGYGKHDRTNGVIVDFIRRDPRTFSEKEKKAVMDCYGTLDKEIAEIFIQVNLRYLIYLSDIVARPVKIPDNWSDDVIDQVALMRFTDDECVITHPYCDPQIYNFKTKEYSLARIGVDGMYYRVNEGIR